MKKGFVIKINKECKIPIHTSVGIIEYEQKRGLEFWVAKKMALGAIRNIEMNGGNARLLKEKEREEDEVYLNSPK